MQINESERLGLAGMMERAALIGGSLKVVSQPGAGAEVVFFVPLSELLS